VVLGQAPDMVKGDVFRDCHHDEGIIKGVAELANFQPCRKKSEGSCKQGKQKCCKCDSVMGLGAFQWHWYRTSRLAFPIDIGKTS